MSLRKTVQTAALADASRDLTGLVRQVKAILPQFSDDVVCQVLAEEDENVERAIENLLTRPEPPKKPGKKKDRSGTAAASSSGTDAAATAASSADVQQKVVNGAASRPQAAATNGAKQGKQQQAPPVVQKSPLDQVLDERPKTPSEKEVQKFKKKLREIEAIEERVRAGEKVDPLQLEKTHNKKEYQIQLHRAERKAEKEVAELIAQLKKEAAEKAWKEAQAPAQPQRPAPAAAASAHQSAGYANQHHQNVADLEEESQDWPQQPAPERQGPSSVQQNGDGWHRVDQRAGQGTNALPPDHIMQLQQEQHQREQLERELFQVQQMHKEQLRREQQQREELQRQLEMERTQRLASEQEVKARLPHPPGVLPEDVQQARRTERAGGPVTPPTAPPSTAPPTTSAAQAPAEPPRAAGAGQELLSLLHSSTSPSADDTSSYEQSANLAKQLGGGVAMGRPRPANEPAKGGKGGMGGSARPAHGPPSVPPHLQQQNNRSTGPQRTATQPPQQPPQEQDPQKQQPRKRENAWHRWPPASLASNNRNGPLPQQTPGEGKEEDERDFINFYSTPLVESQFTEEQREAAERIAREIEMNQGPGTSKSAGWNERGDQSNQARGKSEIADSTGHDRRGGKGWQQDQKGSSWGSDRRKGGKGTGGKGSKKGGGDRGGGKAAAAHTN
mmetsp:Transcript_73593/g.137522  ORF Transcript_73593/g.137522 Transcript_73593/m.137522 type:complete len:673 (+) Transcript_73593:172-2190(+)